MSYFPILGLLCVPTTQTDSTASATAFLVRFTIERTHSRTASYCEICLAVSAWRIDLTIRPDPSLILVALVCGNAHHCAQAWCFSDRLQKMHCTHEVGCTGADRVGIGSPNDRLRRQMEGDFRRKIHHRSRELGVITDIAAKIFNDGVDACQVE